MTPYEWSWMMICLGSFLAFVGICVVINYEICQSNERKRQAKKKEKMKNLFYENERQVEAWRNK